MSGQPLYAPDRKVAPHQPRAIRKNGRQLDCELRDHGGWGVEMRVYREGKFLYGRRWATGALALAEADARKAQNLREGGVLI